MPSLARKRLRRIPKAKRKDVTRGEYNALVDRLNERGRILDSVLRTLDVQFRRMAQMQAEIDALRAASPALPRLRTSASGRALDRDS